MTSLLDDPLLAKVPEVLGYRTLGPVALFAEIGRGGMGAVYRGRHLNLDIDVAVKCLLDTTGDADLIARFRREAMLVAKIRSPHLVQVMDVRNEYGLHYIVMEFVAGETVEGRIRRRGALPPNEALAIALAAAKGLAAAHQKGVIHRDVKPGNVLISTDGEVKLLDLGIAKGKSETIEVEATLTTTVMGTPLYMPPEQFESAANVTPAADVYSLGATLAFMLLGQHAIKGRTLPEITREVTVRGFPDLLQRAPQLPTEVVALVKRATAMDPAARPADAKALATDLQRVLTALGGPPALSDADAMRPASDQVPAPSPTVLAEIRRSVTTRSQPNLAHEDEDEPEEDTDDGEPVDAVTVRSVGAGATAEAGPKPVPPTGPAAASATLSRPGPSVVSDQANAAPSGAAGPGSEARGTRRRSSFGIYAALLLLGGGATAVAWHFSHSPEAPGQRPVATGERPQEESTGASANGPSNEVVSRTDAPSSGGSKNPDPPQEPKTAPPAADDGKAAKVEAEAPGATQPSTDRQPAGPPPATTAPDTPNAKTDPSTARLDPAKVTDERTNLASESAGGTPTSPTPNPELPATKPEGALPKGDPVANPPVAEAKTGTSAPKTDEPGPSAEPAAAKPAPAPLAPPAPTAAEAFATASEAARAQAQAADWNAMVLALDAAFAAAPDDDSRARWVRLADELLARCRASLREDLATAASERAAKMATWSTSLPRFAENGSGAAALLLVESLVSYDEARDKIVCAEPAAALRWARLAATAKVARGAFYAGELLRLDAAATDGKNDAKAAWQLVHESYLRGVELGDADCAARIAGIYFIKRAFKQPLLWSPPGIDNLDAWAARLARQARAQGTPRGHFTLSQFLLHAAQDKAFSQSSGLSEASEKTTYPKELEQAARLGYAPALAELRRKETDEKQRWATEALQRLRREGVIDR